MNTFPDPQPALWAPRLRRTLTRFFASADRRKARRQARVWLALVEADWHREYSTWWMDYGWREGADNPDTALFKLRASR